MATANTPLETVYKLSYALDALNYDALAPLFPRNNKKFTFDIFAILKQPAKDVTLAEYFETALGGLGGFDATQHVLSNPLVSVDDAGGKAHVKVMVSAYHGLKVEGGGMEGAVARVTWNIDLEKVEGGWVVVKWVIQAMVPIDRPDVFERGHKLAHGGKLREGVSRP